MVEELKREKELTESVRKVLHYVNHYTLLSICPDNIKLEMAKINYNVDNIIDLIECKIAPF